jgi:GAF domain-containing protein
MRIDDETLQRALAALAAADLRQGELEASLREVVGSTRVIFDAAGAGIMLIDDGQVMHYVAATDARSAALEAAQEETGEGPCVDSLINDTIVHTADLATDPRWPTVSEALGGLGIHAILGVPIRIGGAAVGSLNTYRDHPGEWDGSEITAIAAHGRIIEEVLTSALLAREQHTIVTQLRHALDSRVTIERAVGVVMARRGLDPVKAFNELRLRARSERRRVIEVAQEVLDSPDFRPDPAVLDHGGA